MDTPHQQRVVARMAAVNFVLAHGEEISDDAATLTDFFTGALLSFERHASDIWHKLGRQSKLHLAWETAKEILSRNLESLNQRLFPHGRFEWRQKLCRLILTYMIERHYNEPDGSLDALIDYYLLIRDGINYDANYRGKLLSSDELLDYDSAADMKFTLSPN